MIHVETSHNTRNPRLEQRKRGNLLCCSSSHPDKDGTTGNQCEQPQTNVAIIARLWHLIKNDRRIRINRQRSSWRRRSIDSRLWRRSGRFDNRRSRNRNVTPTVFLCIFLTTFRYMYNSIAREDTDSRIKHMGKCNERVESLRRR